MRRTTLAAVILAATAGEAVSSPDFPLTPRHFAERSKAVIGTKVIERDEDAGTMTLKVTDVFKGEFKPKTIKVTTTDDTRDEPIFMEDGQLIVAFVSRRGGRGAEEVLFYTGGGIWQRAEIVDDEPTQWKWTDVYDDKSMRSFSNCFNGDSERLVEMMADYARGRYYFPLAYDFHRYSQVVVDTFDKPLRGVALYDVNGNGKLDIYATSEAGNRLYVQTEPMKFADATEQAGLAGIAGVSCSFADANADGRADLLADGVIYVQGQDGKFSKTPWLPAGADDSVKSSAFVELNGDGYPDVVVSQVGGGLHAYLNPGEGGGAFRGASEAMGLSKEACGAGGTGFFAPGDWNDDGRTDLFYAAFTQPAGGCC